MPPTKNEKAPKAPFEIDKALNEKGFTEFLAKHPDHMSIDMDDADALEKWHDAFEQKNEVSKQLKEVYKEWISKKLGVLLDAKDLSSIDDTLDQVAIQNPESISEYNEKIEGFKKSVVDLAALEQQAKQLPDSESLRQSIDSFETQKNAVELAAKSTGIIGKTKLYGKMLSVNMRKWFGGKNTDWTTWGKDKESVRASVEALKTVEDTFGPGAHLGYIGENLDENIKQTKLMLDKVANLDEKAELAKEQFVELQVDLFGGMANFAAVAAAIKQKAEKMLSDLAKGGDLKTLAKGQEKLEFFESIIGNESGVDPVTDIDKFQKEFDTAIEQKLGEAITNQIRKTKLGTNAFSNLEASFDKLIAENGKLGSKEGDEARAFIIETLESARDGLTGGDAEMKTKQLFLNRIIIKLQK